MSASTSFWDWALAAYARPGVAAACLDLQDVHRQNVPLLLWAVWAGVEGRKVDAGLAAATARDWQAVIEPLREVRRRLKTSVSNSDDDLRLPLRDQVKSVELAAEKALMVLLERQTPSPSVDMQALASISGARAALVLNGLLGVAMAWQDDAPAKRLAFLTSLLLAED